MEPKSLNVRLAKLPPDIDLTRFAMEEHKSTALFNGLALTGLEDSYPQMNVAREANGCAGVDCRASITAL